MRERVYTFVVKLYSVLQERREGSNVTRLVPNGELVHTLLLKLGSRGMKVLPYERKAFVGSVRQTFPTGSSEHEFFVPVDTEDLERALTDHAIVAAQRLKLIRNKGDIVSLNCEVVKE